MPDALAPEEHALLDRVARRVAELRMETPALLTLETARPVSVLAGQAMLFFEPVVQAVLALPDWRRFALLIERREALDVLADRIESHATDMRARRDSGRPAAHP